ncbi:MULTISPECIES: methyltransferase domain-containing protein [unclassified Gordonia (in: high G+C Gram-positive bacteria)]
MAAWDPARYLKFADARARPFLDLVAQVPITPSTVVDLGCGPGQHTRHLRERWPDAHVLGVDSSAEMIESAIRINSDSHANYDVADLTEWTPAEPVDLFLSNAVFQWVPEQMSVIGRLIEHLTDEGAFAIQVPNQSGAATHQALTDLAAADPYAEYLHSVRRLPACPPEQYLTFFAEHGFVVNAWESTYLHVLADKGEDPVFDWISGTGARPYLLALPDEMREGFTTELRERLRAAYPAQPWGTVLPYRRTFAVATRN